MPEHLYDTDLFTFDSATLARYGVIAYAPAYPLWSDNAAKPRHIRVPRGTSVQFDKATQSFTIPPNTRFYKTFSKQIVDVDGSVRFRKIETRLIVSRPDTKNADEIDSRPTALYGTYKWNDDESDAVLGPDTRSTAANRSQTPFSSTWSTSRWPLTSSRPIRPTWGRRCWKATPRATMPFRRASVASSATRAARARASFWGSCRCRSTAARWARAGIIEATGPDELDAAAALHRLRHLITGLDSPSDILPLESSEGSRSPRNEQELLAQGYMLGNCAHCHNPNGFPSIQNPVLVNVLNFVPGLDGGIFQFPLDRTSPRIFRGSVGETPIPYITPSLMDLPRSDLAGAPVADPFTVADSSDSVLVNAMFAPWRSLIYRNVDNPFAYTDDLALYPHMPMNTPGYDPRAKQLLSDWMVSIPAVRKSPQSPEYAFYAADGLFGGSSIDTNPQTLRARCCRGIRVTTMPVLRRPSDWPFCIREPTRISRRVRTPRFIRGMPIWARPKTFSTRPSPPIRHATRSRCPPSSPPSTRTRFRSTITGSSPTPTPDPGNWSPRRPDWVQALADQMPPAPCEQLRAEGDHERGRRREPDEGKAISRVAVRRWLADAEGYLTTLVPFGLWQQKSGCDFTTASSPPVSSFTGANQPLWISHAQNLSPSAPVYLQTPGEAVFKMICINCHGPLGDANGRLARNLAIMSGGLAEVADFRDGLFGPVGSTPATSDIDRVFGSATVPASWAGVPDEDRAARYMAWMALGGTKVKIPPAILEIVAVTQVLDQHRGLFGTPVSGNMLSTAKGLCTVLLGAQEYENATFQPANPTAYSTTLIHSNGDAELAKASPLFVEQPLSGPRDRGVAQCGRGRCPLRRFGALRSEPGGQFTPARGELPRRRSGRQRSRHRGRGAPARQSVALVRHRRDRRHASRRHARVPAEHRHLGEHADRGRSRLLGRARRDQRRAWRVHLRQQPRDPEPAA